MWSSCRVHRAVAGRLARVVDGRVAVIGHFRSLLEWLVCIERGEKRSAPADFLLPPSQSFPFLAPSPSLLGFNPRPRTGRLPQIRSMTSTPLGRSPCRHAPRSRRTPLPAVSARPRACVRPRATGPSRRRTRSVSPKICDHLLTSEGWQIEREKGIFHHGSVPLSLPGKKDASRTNFYPVTTTYATFSTTSSARAE